MPGPPIATERDLWLLWERRALPAGMTTRDGRRVVVLFPGLPNTGPGPDFLGALLALEGDTVRRGDVELHLRATSWDAHGHQHDPRYNQVALHVVLFDDGGPARTLSDRAVPVLALGAHLHQDPAPPPTSGGPCMRQGAPVPDSPQLRELLEAAGMTRFEERAAGWEAEFTVCKPEVVVLRALLRAAGLGRNRQPCLDLSALLDGCTFETLIASAGPGAEHTAAAVLLGMAGLLEAAHATPEERETWRRLRDFWPGTPLDQRCWERFRLRPAHRPERRLRAVATIAARDGLCGFLDRCAAVVERNPISPDDLHNLVCTGGAGGRGWALEVWTNVLLPLLAGRGAQMDQPQGIAAATATYRGLPGGGENHILTRMSAICRLPRPPRAAVQQQGLLHLWQRYCSRQACDQCPLAAASNLSDRPC